MADDRHHHSSDGDRPRARARRERVIGARHKPDLDLQYDLAELVAEANDLERLAPPLLHLLVGRLALAAAEFSVQSDDTAPDSPVGHWLVRDTLDGTSSTPDLHCSSEQTFRIEGDGRAILRAYSRTPRPLDVPTQRFLRSVGQQITRFVEARTQAKRCEVMAARQAVLLAAARGAAPTNDAPASDAAARGRTLDTTAELRRLAAYQERLRKLTADLLLAEEHERRQLASDLHDGLSQTIALIRMRVGALAKDATQEQAAALRDIEHLVEQANQAARSVSFELSPPVLHDFGLEPALEWLAENISTRYGLTVQFDHDERPKPTNEKTRIILFRSIRELLINAAKHAKAHLVKVKLERVGDELHASVNDDGLGMDPELEQARGSGLFSIVERLHHVGGDMSIHSERGHGTSVKLRAHIADDAQLALDPRSTGRARHEARGPLLGANQGVRP